MSLRVLHVDSSLFGDNGASVELGKALVSKLKDTYPDADVTYHDLVQEAVPHFTAETIAAIGDGSAVLADQYIAEVKAADIIVVGAPMYNFMIPTQLKAWLDHITRAGSTFKYTESGPEGLLDGRKKVIVLSSRGGAHKGQSTDLVTPYLKTILGFVGLEDVHFIYAEALAMADREKVMDEAKREISAYLQALQEAQEVV